jgi:SAM-dependent methyltransferase
MFGTSSGMEAKGVPKSLCEGIKVVSILIGSRNLIDEDWNKPAWGNNEAVIDFLGKTGLLRSPRKILEIGSGKGRMLRYLVDSGHDAVGLDMNPHAIAEADRDLTIHEGLATRLPFADDTFDLVVSFDLFEHVLESDVHVNEVKRVLKDGGYYLLQTPNKWTNITFEVIRFSRKYGIRHTFDFLKPPYHCALHNYWQLKSRFQKHGFEVTFYDIPTVNDFFRDKIRRFRGRFGLIMLKLLNPDKFPMPLRTNFYVQARMVSTDDHS